ncbi:MAG TPA: 5-oxoprolinase subunit PxpA [Bryobacteraceae bacterium]|nr:5-oxoprolinase subunit PxpA [Bryobacteraceae bacterium]
MAHKFQPRLPASVERTIDLNCDMGELPDGAIEAALMQHITSANVACGGHTGDADSMRRTAGLADLHGVAIGAHPSYPDRAHFGRMEMALPAGEIADTVSEQIAALAAVTGDVTHVKPHGALYNVAAKNPAVARAVGEGVARFSREIVLVGLAGSVMLEVWRAMGLSAAAEGFADRRYEPDGSLRSRKFAGALIVEPEMAAAQALRLAAGGQVETICIHSDTPGSVDIAAAVSETLRRNGWLLRPLANAAR